MTGLSDERVMELLAALGAQGSKSFCRLDILQGQRGHMV